MGKNCYSFLVSNPHFTINISSGESFNATINCQNEETTVSFVPKEYESSCSSSDDDPSSLNQDSSEPFDELDEISLSAL